MGEYCPEYPEYLLTRDQPGHDFIVLSLDMIIRWTVVSIFITCEADAMDFTVPGTAFIKQPKSRVDIYIYNQ